MSNPDLIGKTAVWKIRVYGPAKFAERSDVVAFISGNSAFTKGGRELRLIDMVATPAAVGGGGMWALATTDAPAVNHVGLTPSEVVELARVA